MTDPADFGAMGQGGDDARAIQRAIESGAKRIIGRRGAVYGIGSSGIRLRGLKDVVLDFSQSRFKLLESPVEQAVHTLGKTAIKFDKGCENCGLVAGEIDGNGVSAAAIGFDTTKRCYLEKTTIHHCGINAQVVAAGNQALRIEANHVFAGIGTARGLWLGNVHSSEIETGLVVVRNELHDNPASGLALVSVGGEVRGNVCRANAGSGIAFSGANGFSCSDLTIAENVCEANLFHGIQDDVVYTTEADLTGFNVITSNTCIGNIFSGLYFVNSHDTIVAGNICRDNNADGAKSGYGIFASDRVRNLIIAGNECIDTRTGAARTQTGGIGAVATIASPSNLSISRNRCDDNLYDGILIQANAGQLMRKITVRENKCNNNGRWGIAIHEADRDALSGLCTANVTFGNGVVDLVTTATSFAESSNQYRTRR